MPSPTEFSSPRSTASDTRGHRKAAWNSGGIRLSPIPSARSLPKPPATRKRFSSWRATRIASKTSGATGRFFATAALTLTPPFWSDGSSELLAAEFSQSVLPRLLDARRSEEHTSELQSQFHLVCRLLLEK